MFHHPRIKHLRNIDYFLVRFKLIESNAKNKAFDWCTIVPIKIQSSLLPLCLTHISILTSFSETVIENVKCRSLIY